MPSSIQVISRICSIAVLLGLIPAGLSAGDHNCVVHFDLFKVGVNGGDSLIGYRVNYGDSITVALLPGEVVRLQRGCPGCSNCPPMVGVLRHEGDPSTFASQTDPLLDTLWISQSLTATISEPGSYFLRGCPCYSLFGGSSFSLRILHAAEHIGTTVLDRTDEKVELWTVPGQLLVRAPQPAELNMVDMTGRTVSAVRINATYELVAFDTSSLPSGNYVAILRYEIGTFRKKLRIN